MNDEHIEQEIRAKGLTAPRITRDDIEAAIASEHYFTAAEGVSGAARGGRIVGDDARPLHLLTFCVLVLQNGFTVTGESACASPENFDADLGKKIARQAAISKVWTLMGYALKDKLASVPKDFRDRVRLEKSELDEKREALAAFFGTTTFTTLPAAEQSRMRDQLDAMRNYSAVLGERIDAFAT